METIKIELPNDPVILQQIGLIIDDRMVVVSDEAKLLRHQMETEPELYDDNKLEDMRIGHDILKAALYSITYTGHYVPNNAETTI